MHRAFQIIHQHGDVDFFFFAQQLGGAHFFRDGTMRRQAIAGMRLAHVNKNELDGVAEFFGQLVDTADRAGGHGTSGGTEGQDNVLLAAKIAESENIAFQAAQLEIGRAVAGLRAAKAVACQILSQQFLGEVGIVVVGTETEHGASW